MAPLIPHRMIELLIHAGFIFFALVTVIGALVAVLSRRLIRNVCGLIFSFFGLAGLYFYLGSPFLALMQIVIYVGAVCIMIMFSMMLAEPKDAPPRTPARRLLAGFVGLASVVCAGLLVFVAKGVAWPAPKARANPGAAADIGRDLLTQHGIAFEWISLLLLVAILGAVIVARAGRRKE